MARLRTLRLLLNEITDKYVQENFYKLKLYIDDLEAVLDTGITGPQGPPGTTGPAGPSAVTVPRLTQEFDTDVGTIAGDLVYLNGTNTVTKIVDNTSALIPNGMFGVGYFKPVATKIEVMFVGIGSGYVGLTAGAPVWISTLGVPTHTIPSTGMVQQIGFAISSTEIFFNLMQPMRKT
jgi:hypothetical protein